MEVSINDQVGKGKITFELFSHQNSNSVMIKIPLQKGTNEEVLKWIVDREALIKGINALK